MLRKGARETCADERMSGARVCISSVCTPAMPTAGSRNASATFCRWLLAGLNGGHFLETRNGLLRSNDFDHMYRRLIGAPDGNPTWKHALAELDSASCRDTYRCGKRLLHVATWLHAVCEQLGMQEVCTSAGAQNQRCALYQRSVNLAMALQEPRG